MFVTRRPLNGLLLATAAAAPLPALAQEVPPTAPAPAPAPAPSATPVPQPQPPRDKSNDLVVTGGRNEVQTAVDRLSFDVSKDLQVQTGTLADALRAVPGVEVDLEGKVSLRGDSGVTILIDGRPSAMMRGESRGTVILSMPAAQIERVEVITNPSAAFSPEGSAGVINLITRRPRAGQQQGPTRALTLRGTVGLEGRGSLGLSSSYAKGPLTMTGDLNYRRFTTDNGLTQERVRSGAGGTPITTRQESEQDNVMSARTARLGIDYDIDKQNRLSTEINVRDLRLATERSDLVTGLGGYARQSDIAMTNRGVGARTSWRHTLPGTGHEFSADVEFEHMRVRREIDGVTTPAGGSGAVYEAIRNALRRDEINVKLDYKRPLGEGRSLNIGYQGEYSDTAFDFTGARGATTGALTPVAGLTNAFAVDQKIHAWFATLSIDTGKFEVQPGLRLEQVELSLDQVTDATRFDNDYFRAYPTLHLGYELSTTQKLRGSYSRRVQRPSAQDLNPYTIYIDPLNLRRGNPALVPEVTDSFELGWQLRKGGTFYSGTVFYRTSRGGVTDVVTDLGGTFLTTRANLAASERAGVEAIANGKFSRTLSYNLSATLLWNQIDARIGGVRTPRSGTTWTLRGNLSWQPTPNDFFQLNGFLSGDQLIAQGYRRSGGVLNLGYRRKLDERFSLLLTAQNVLDSARFTTVIETPAFRDRIEQRGAGRIVLLGLTYNLGQSGRRRQEPAFDFDQGGAPQ